MLFGKTPFREYTDISVKDVNEWQRKYEKKMTIITVALMVVLVLVVVTKSSIYEGKIDAAKTTAQQMKEKDIKIAVINKGGGNTGTGFSHEYFVGAQQEGESMGLTVEAFSANHDITNFRNLILQSMDRNYDGIIIESGNDEVVKEIKKVAAKGIPIVAFNCSSKLAKIKGITMTSLGVQMAQRALENMNLQLNRKGNIIYLWETGYPGVDDRHRIYEQFLKENPEIKEVERFGVVSSTISTITQQTKNAVAEMLKKHRKGKIDAIFAIMAAYAKGATQAVKEAGRDEVKIYSTGFTYSALQMMQEKDSPWISTTGVDLRELGAVNVRLLLKKIAGEETPAEYEFKPSLITQDELRKVKGMMNKINLQKVIRGWGENDDFKEDWMEELKESHVCKPTNTRN